MTQQIHQLIPRRSQLDFNFQDMGVIYDQGEGKADKTHRHDYYTVLFVERAKGSHIIDFKTYPFQEDEIHFVSPGQAHQVNLEARPKGWAITFSKNFLLFNNIPESFISNINLFRNVGETPPLTITPGAKEKFTLYLKEMELLFSQEIPFKRRALGALLQLFLINSTYYCRLDPVQFTQENQQVCILRDFKKLVEQKHVLWHKVNEYAESINISSKYLSSTVKNITGKTAKEFIQDRLILESKRLLLFSDLSIKQVAYQLGFEEPLHFSSFFKKQTGLSPSHFRSKKMIS